MKYINNVELMNLCYELLEMKGVKNSNELQFDKLEEFEFEFGVNLETFRKIASFLIKLTPTVELNNKRYHRFYSYSNGHSMPIATIEADE